MKKHVAIITFQVVTNTGETVGLEFPKYEDADAFLNSVKDNTEALEEFCPDADISTLKFLTIIPVVNGEYLYPSFITDYTKAGIKPKVVEVITNLQMVSGTTHYLGASDFACSVNTAITRLSSEGAHIDITYNTVPGPAGITVHSAMLVTTPVD